MTQHNGGIVSNQRINPNGPRSVDPHRIIHGPNRHVQSCCFGYLYETSTRQSMMQRQRRRGNVRRLVDDSLLCCEYRVEQRDGFDLRINLFQDLDCRQLEALNHHAFLQRVFFYCPNTRFRKRPVFGR